MRKSGLVIMLAPVLLGGLAPLFVTVDEVGADELTGTEMRPDRITVSCQYPSASGAADTQFMFDVSLMYQLTDLDPLMGEYDTGRLQSRTFTFELTAPEGWDVFVAESSWKLDQRIKAMSLRALGVPTNIVVVASAPWWENIQPGEYPITLKVISDSTTDTLNLKAVVSAWYGIDATTADQRLNAKTTAGNPAEVSLKVVNTGSAVLDKVSVSSSRPAGIANEQWIVRFEPNAVKGLAPGEEQQVKVSITPPDSAISGDYYVTLTLDTEPALSDIEPALEVRVSVVTRTQWIVVGVAIVILSFGALMYAFYVLRQR